MKAAILIWLEKGLNELGEHFWERVWGVIVWVIIVLDAYLPTGLKTT